MSTRKAAVHAFIVLASLFVFRLGFAVISAQGQGKPIAEADVAAWDISILPDGTGLPSGSGTSAQGATIFAAKCALCHGEGAKGGANAALVGGAPLTAGIETAKTV